MTTFCFKKQFKYNVMQCHSTSITSHQLKLSSVSPITTSTVEEISENVV